LDKATSDALFSHATSVTLLSSLSLFLTMLLSFYFLKVSLKCSKQLTSKGYKAWEVCEGKVIIFKSNYCTCFIACRLTCEPCPSKINRCWWLFGMPIKIDLLKNDKNYLNKTCHPCFGLDYHTCSRFIVHNIINSDTFTPKYVKFW
jgi:hypothetical protein